MPDQETLTPSAYLRASKAGVPIAILLLAWTVGFSFYRSSLSPPVYWTVAISVGILLVAVPCWLVGRRARREHLKEQDPTS